MSEDGFGYDEVEWCGDLDVLPIAVNKCDSLSVCLHYRGIVGERIAVGLAIGSFEQLYVEALGSLYQAVFVTRNGVGELRVES